MSEFICPSTKIENILIAADACVFCDGAVREGINLAKGCGSKLTALSVLELNEEMEAVAPEAVEEMGLEVNAFMNSVKMRASKEGIDCATIVRQGDDAAELIIEEAGNIKADLIITGRRGRQGLNRLLMGSVTANVIAKAACNVLVVPNAATMTSGLIVAATDGSKFSDLAVVEGAKIAKRLGSRMIIVSAIPSDDSEPMDITSLQMERDAITKMQTAEVGKMVEKAKKLVADMGVEAETAVVSGEPYGAIVDFAKENKADLITVGSHGRTKFQRMFIGSVSERIVGLSACPVLVVKS